MSTGSVLSSTPAPPAPASRPGFVDVDRIANAHGMVAIISQRPSTGALTFSIFREFERESGPGRTGFIPDALREPYLELVKITFEAMDRLKATGKLPYPIAGDRAGGPP